MLFPGETCGSRTGIELVRDREGFPYLLGTRLLAGGDSAGESGSGWERSGLPLLGEHARGLYERPHLRGHRSGGRGWSTRFACQSVAEVGDNLTIELVDPEAALALRTELASVPGGALRARHRLTNTGPDEFLLEGLEVVLPAADDLVELLDLTGRHERERNPQRRHVTDGLWLRESRTGRPGLGAATLAVLGSDGFSTTYGEVLGVHVAWSGNSVLRVERGPGSATTIGGGELLLPGEVCLAPNESYTTPWVYFAAADDGLDGLAAVWHGYQRTLAAHPAEQPVVLNVWEAVYFDHDLDRLTGLADRAARVGVERFVLDDGWFDGRRDDTRGLGDWSVDEGVWPAGLNPLIDRVRELGMQFGLWIEPEMVNPDSALFRQHPDWILSAGGRTPLQHRNQQVLDLTRTEVFEHIFTRIDAVLTAHPVDYVKWDHNRDLLEAGSGELGGAAVVHGQTLAFYALLDALRAAHPRIDWESCAAGGGRIDLAVLERVQRVWTSDMTDALARQRIQRWTTQLVAPEYVGAHVSSPTSHTTGRTLSLDFRAATAMFGAFGIEWDLGTAGDDELARLADWVDLHKRFRPMLHAGRVVRPESGDETVLLHGVIAADASEALVAHVQLDEPPHNRGTTVRLPGLDPLARYALGWAGPVDLGAVSMSSPLHPAGPTRGTPVTGTTLERVGFWLPRRRPETVTLIHLTRL